MIMRILVLGIDGMVGNGVFKYLQQNNNFEVFGTSRRKYDNKHVFKFETDSFESDLHHIPLVDYAINCIGALKNKTSIEQEKVNTIFPKTLSSYLSQQKIKLIHISTDAVFAENTGGCDESTTPNPSKNHNKDYSQSKLKGEINQKPHITIRTSLIGIGSSGLIHDILESKEKSIKGYDNQWWSGCTTLQFAKFCEDIILGQDIGKKANLETIIHFTPIGPITKYEIVKSVKEIFRLQKNVVREKSVPIQRFLISKIIDLKDNPRYTNSILDAISELKEFYTE